VQSIYNRDYPVVQCTVFLAAVMFIIINFAVDLFYGFLDPRAQRQLSSPLPARRRPGRAAGACRGSCGWGWALSPSSPCWRWWRRGSCRIRSGSRCASASSRPRWRAPTDGRNLLGTDHLGRDVLARVVFGSRVSLVVGFSAVLVGGLLGSTMGLIAGYRGGRWTRSS
jgi:ABC-type dipeptide/oligopeptide/nickel transport system permease subunit